MQVLFIKEHLCQGYKEEEEQSMVRIFWLAKNILGIPLYTVLLVYLGYKNTKLKYKKSLLFKIK